MYWIVLDDHGFVIEITDNEKAAKKREKDGYTVIAVCQRGEVTQ